MSSRRQPPLEARSSKPAAQTGSPDLTAPCYAVLAQGLAPSIRRTYTTGQRLFFQFCQQSRVLPLPSTEWLLMLFATWLVSARRLSSASVSVCLAAVRSLHRPGPPGPHGGHTPASSAHLGYQTFCRSRASSSPPHYWSVIRGHPPLFVFTFIRPYLVLGGVLPSILRIPQSRRVYMSLCI